MSNPTLSELTRRLEDGVRGGAFPAAQACVIYRGELVHSSAHGADHRGRPATEASLFDVASVTKLAATTLATAVLISRGDLALSTRAAALLPQFTGGGKETVTIRELLAHASGLAAWEPFFVLVESRLDSGVSGGNLSGERVPPDPLPKTFHVKNNGGHTEHGAVIGPRERAIVKAAALRSELTAARGERVYSDLGFMVLGFALESASGVSLDSFCHHEIFAPLGLERTGYIPLGRSGRLPRDAHILPTGLTRPREPAPGQEAVYAVPAQEPRAVPGEVDDDNAYTLGGVAGHAGLFSRAEDLARLGRAIIEELNGAGRLGIGETLAELARPDTETKGALRGLGFDIPAGEGSMAGELLGRAGPKGAIGHLGFTGCSLWIDLDRELVVALLTNRVFPTRRNIAGIRAFRPAFHDAVVHAAGG